MRRQLGVLIHYDLHDDPKLFRVYTDCFYALTSIQITV